MDGRAGVVATMRIKDNNGHFSSLRCVPTVVAKYLAEYRK